MSSPDEWNWWHHALLDQSEAVLDESRHSCGNGTTFLTSLIGPSAILSVCSRGAVNIERHHILRM